MSNSKSGIWSVALPLSVIFLGAAYYIKVPEVREAVDKRTPMVRNLLGRFVQESGTEVIVMQGEMDPLFAKPKPASMPAPAPVVSRPLPPAEQVAKSPETGALSNGTRAPSAPPEVPRFDLQQLAANPSRWPKKVTLQKPTRFPAVLNGRVVGELVAPAGSEATLKLIKDDKVGLEFNGGGAWALATETDLMARVQTPR